MRAAALPIERPNRPLPRQRGIAAPTDRLPSLSGEVRRARNRITAPSPRHAGRRSGSAYEISASMSKLLPTLAPFVRSSRPAQRTRGDLGDSRRARPTATLFQTGDLFDHLAVYFMTRGDLHDRGAYRRNSKPYGLSICLSTSVGLRSIVGTTKRLMAKDGSRDRVNPRYSLVEEMSLPPGKPD